jgi:hypothetical protein
VAELKGSSGHEIPSRSLIEFLPVNLIQDHNESRDEHIVDMRKHGNDKRVPVEQHVRNSELTVHLSYHCGGVAEVEGAGPVEVVALDLEIADLLRGVPSQEHVHLCLELDHRRFFHGKEQIACVCAVPSEHFPSIVHTEYLIKRLILNYY